MDSLLHVVLPGVDVLQPQELLRAVQGVRGEGGLGHVPRARPGEEPRREEKLSFMGCLSPYSIPTELGLHQSQRR